jgi:hypothetical protein
VVPRGTGRVLTRTPEVVPNPTSPVRSSRTGQPTAGRNGPVRPSTSTRADTVRDLVIAGSAGSCVPATRKRSADVHDAPSNRSSAAILIRSTGVSPVTRTVNNRRGGAARNWALSPASGVSAAATRTGGGSTARGSNRSSSSASGSTSAPSTPSNATTTTTGAPNAGLPVATRPVPVSALARTSTSARAATRNTAVAATWIPGRLPTNNSAAANASSGGATGANTTRVRRTSVVAVNAAAQVSSTGVISSTGRGSAGGATASMRVQPPNTPSASSAAVCLPGRPCSRVPERTP